MARIFALTLFLLLTLRCWGQTEYPVTMGGMYTFSFLDLLILIYKPFTKPQGVGIGTIRLNDSPLWENSSLKMVQKEKEVFLNSWWLHSSKPCGYKNCQPSIEVPSENEPESELVEGAPDENLHKSRAITFFSLKQVGKFQCSLSDKPDRINFIFSGSRKSSIKSSAPYYDLYGMGQLPMDMYHLCSFYRIQPVRIVQVWMFRHDSGSGHNRDSGQDQANPGNPFAVYTEVDPQNVPSANPEPFSPDNIPPGVLSLAVGAVALGEDGFGELLRISNSQQELMGRRRNRLTSSDVRDNQDRRVDVALQGLMTLTGVTPVQHDILEREFLANAEPSEDTIQLLSLATGLDQEKIKLWFMERNKLASELEKKYLLYQLPGIQQKVDEIVEYTEQQ